MLYQHLLLKFLWFVKHRILLLLFILLFASNNVQAAISHSPRYDWFTIESAHFRVHYHSGEAALASQTVNIAERVHSKLSAWIQWQPSDKTDLVVSDEFDVSNGFATPFPGNRSQIYISPPDSISSLEDHAGWLEILIMHEYLHILHLDKATNSGATWREVFGRNPFFLFNTFPAASLPGWGIEGLATYIETDKARGVGRGQSSYYDMLMRLEVENGIKPIHQVNQPISSWPMGSTRYLYGVNYYQFIEQQYGAKTINGLVNDFAATLFPFRINNNTEQIVNKNLVVLWAEFKDYLQKKHLPKINSIKNSGLKAGTRLTFNGYFDESLTALADGRLFYVSYDGLRNPSLMIRKGKITRKIIRVESGTRLDVHASAGLLLAQPTLCDNSQYLYDLYQMDLETETMQRLTNCARYRTASWSPDGSQIIAVQNKLGKNELVLLDAKAKKIKTLWSGAQWQVVSSLDWSPDGKFLVAAIFRENSGWNLERFDITNNRWSFLTKNSDIQHYPRISLDSNSVYYSADHDGIYNIFKIALKTKTVIQLTNVLGAAFYPAQVNSKGDLFYISHNTQGMDLYQLPVSAQLLTKINDTSIKNQTTGIALAAAPEVQVSEAEQYSPWSSLRPRWWYPVFAFSDDISMVGFNTSSFDVLSRHNYATLLAYDSKNKVALGALDYIYDRYWPIVKLHYDRRLSILYGSDNKFARAKVTDTTQVETILPFLGLKQQLTTHFVIGKETVNDARRAAGVPLAKEFQDKYYGASVIYNNTSRHPRAISRNEGRQIIFTIEDSDAFKDSFYSGSVKTFDWREFVALGGKHVLAFRVVSGRGDAGSKPFQLGGSNNTSFVPPLLGGTLIDSPFYRREYNLRGYSSGLRSLIGNNINVISAEYRFPLFKLERSFMTPPFGLHELHAALFYDSGAAWDNNVSTPDKYYSGTGVELTAVSLFFFHSRLNIVLGYASGLDKTIGENKAYLRLDAAF